MQIGGVVIAQNFSVDGAMARHSLFQLFCRVSWEHPLRAMVNSCRPAEAGLDWSLRKPRMYRLSVVVMAASCVLSLSAGTVRAECLETVLACESECADVHKDARAYCVPKCRLIIVCEVEPEHAGTFLLESALPASRLPNSRLPKSQMPESTLN